MIGHPGSTPARGGHRYVTRIYYEDTDAGGVVYHASYLRLAERARTEALRDLGVPHAELSSLHGLFFVVRRVKIDYAAAARLDDLVTVATRPIRLGGASVALRQTFFRGNAREGDLPDRPLALAEVGLVCVARRSEPESVFVPARIPDRWRAALASLADDSLAVRKD